MKARYLLDTNILSEPLRPRPNNRVMKGLRRHEGRLVTASVVWHELLYGSCRLPDSMKRKAIEKYLNEVVGATIPILPYDGAAAAWHASERARLANAGKMPPFVDGQIAAIASVNDLVLVTANVEDYRAFGGIDLENWRQ
ncbi:MAG: type II toxin-antitoxin system VapC family toxin [Acidobacteria bacterium]|nr:type II toxin-antitoxin system VapC family toxin [Acidobacteriota bacterium]